ncbi:MAG TPA: hypothetical protein VFI89_09045 [Burkholderiales bacterium]|nr:hypothetical protein [Burkholderiales bacterium]
MEVQIAYSTLRLVFAEAGPAPTLELGPFDEVRIDGEALRCGRGGEVLARHHRHAWLVQQRRFFRLDCESPVRLHFENEYGESSPVYGPFMHFSCADGIAFGDGVIHANLDLESKRWYDHREQRYWPELVVKSASAP